MAIPSCCNIETILTVATSIIHYILLLMTNDKGYLLSGSGSFQSFQADVVVNHEIKAFQPQDLSIYMKNDTHDFI